MFNVIYINYKKKKQKTMNTTKTPILGKISLINLPVTMEQSCQSEAANEPCGTDYTCSGTYAKQPS